MAQSSWKSLVCQALALALVGLGGAAKAHARQDAHPADSLPLTKLSLEELGDIEVTTVSKEPELVRRVAAAIYVITQEDIRRSGATTIPDILRLAPGVDVAQIDGDHWSVGVRGFGDQFSKSVLVLIDGRSVYTPLFAGINWPVQDAAFEDIERIEIIRGPGGTIWGANAVNGVVNIITKSSRDTQGARASIGAGTVDHAIGTLRYGGGRGSTSYRVYGKGFTRGSQFHTDGYNFDDWSTGQAGFRADWTGTTDALTIQGDVYRGAAGQSVGIGSLSPPSQTIVYNPMHISGGNLVAVWRRDVSAGSGFQVQAYYDRTRLLGPQIGEVRHTFDVDFVHRLQTLPRQSVISGAGLRLSPSTITQTVSTVDVSPHDHTDRIVSAFAQDELTVVAERLWVTVGAKLEHNTYTGVEVQPTARILWTPTHVQSAWASVTRAVRTPSRLEEDFELTGFLGGQPPAFVRIVGNDAFKSETLLGYEAGYRRVISPQLYVDVSVFHNRHENLQSLGTLALSVETSPPPARVVLTFAYANGVMGTSEGFEISPDWKPTRWWQMKGVYSYLHIDLQNQPGNVDTSAVTKYQGSSPRHQVLIRSLFDIRGGWQFDQTYRYVSELPARSVDGYATADLRLAWRVTPRIELSIAGRNLLQPRHFEFAHDPGPMVALKRSAYAYLTWQR